MIFKKRKGTGALEDTRPESLKQKDYKFEEIVATANPVSWVEKPQAEWRKFPIYNQDNSGSCVAQTLAKLLGILYWLKNSIYVHFSATHIYQRRSNKPVSGMAGVNALDIAREGVTLEELAPSQNLNDAQMDAVKIEQYKQDVGKIFKINNYVVITSPTIDTIASVIQTTNKGVMVWFYFLYEEWTDIPFIKDLNLSRDSKDIVRHSVTAVDSTLYNGRKALIIEDSWGKQYGLNGQRVITEDFFKARNFFAAYPMNFNFDISQETKPKYTFSKTLQFSSSFSVDPDVKALQDVLRYESLFPANTQSTGYFGSITSKAVLAFQEKYQVASQTELDKLQGRVVGPKTIKKLNELYG